MKLRSAFSYCVSVTLLVALLQSGSTGQEFRLPYFTPPQKPVEFWNALQYELELGNQSRAKELLRGFYDKVSALNPEEQQQVLLQLYDEEGASGFIRLSNIAELRKVSAKEPGTDKDRPVVDLVLDLANKAVTKRLEDPERMKRFIANLNQTRTPEERDYAVAQLRLHGARAVPYMVDVLLDDAQRAEHPAIFRALLKMNRDIGPPLLAALEVDKPNLRSIIISVFLQRADDRIVPYLWYLRGLKNQPGELRKQIDETLAKFLRVPVQDLPEPKVVLAQEADRYYKHEAILPPGEELTIWLWDDKADPHLVKKALNRSQYEEVYGSYWAKKALELDPAYKPAQIVLLSLLLDKAYERGGVEQPLAKTAPDLHQLLAGTNSSLLEAVLDRALTEGRAPVVLGVVQALGPTGEWKLIRGSDKGAPPLVRAMNYADRRVQFAAADAILQVPTQEPFPGSSRVVEILRRTIVTKERPTALIAYLDQERGRKLEALLKQWGLDTVITPTGRDAGPKAVERVIQSADIDVIFLDARVPDLAYVLSQLRSPEAGGVPIVLVTPADKVSAVTPIAARFSRILIPTTPATDPDMLEREQVDAFLGKSGPPLTPEERALQTVRAMDWLARIGRGEIAGYDLRPAEDAIYLALSMTNDGMSAMAAEILSHRSGRKVQDELARLVLNSTRSDQIRAWAAKQLQIHKQRYGLLLKPDDIAKLIALPKEAEGPFLKEESARLAASLHSNPDAAGNALKQFTPAPPKPPMPVP